MQEHMKKKKVEVMRYMEEKGISLEEYKVLIKCLYTTCSNVNCQVIV